MILDPPKKNKLNLGTIYSNMVHTIVSKQTHKPLHCSACSGLQICFEVSNILRFIPNPITPSCALP